MQKDREFRQLEEEALTLSKRMEEIYKLIKEKYPPEDKNDSWVLYPGGFYLIDTSTWNE